ncbi:MAG: glycoside hydrolase family 13 protein [Candidatus Limnocylindria bacterium]
MTDAASGDPPAWVADAIFYQIFPDRFARSDRVPAPGPLEDWDAPPTIHGFKGGDLYGIVEHLDHLADLGVTAIYLNPIFASASNHRYHTYDYMAVDPLLGGDAALRELLDAAHGRGIRVILDAVLNHASRGFWPFHHVMETGLHSPYRDWFHLDADSLEAGRPLRAYPDERIGTTLAVDWGDEHRAGTDSITTLGYRAWWDLPALPKLNTDNPVAREYLMGVAEHWTRFGIDGWRLDVPREIETPGFWEEFRGRVRAINPDAYIVAEVWQERPDLLDGTTYDGFMNYPLAEAIISFVTGPHLRPEIVGQHTELGRHIRPEDGATFLSRASRTVSAYPPRTALSMLNLLDSHDSPRLLSMAGGDRASLRLAWLALLTLPGAPCIYYGDEVGLSGEMDPGCRAAFPWDRERWDEELLAHLRDLITLRAAEPALRSAELEPLGSDGMAIAYRRGVGPGALVVALNAGHSTSDLRLPMTAARLTPVSIGRDEGAEAEVRDGAAIVRIPPRSGQILRVA